MPPKNIVNWFKKMNGRYINISIIDLNFKLIKIILATDTEMRNGNKNVYKTIFRG